VGRGCGSLGNQAAGRGHGGLGDQAAPTAAGEMGGGRGEAVGENDTQPQ
jgi:hypothetical protein